MGLLAIPFTLAAIDTYSATISLESLVMLLDHNDYQHVIHNCQSSEWLVQFIPLTYASFTYPPLPIAVLILTPDSVEWLCVMSSALPEACEPSDDQLSFRHPKALFTVTSRLRLQCSSPQFLYWYKNLN